MIRSATAEDASRLAEIYIFAKRSAYRSIFKNDWVSFNELQVLPLALELRDDARQRRDLFVYDDGIVRGLMRWDRSQSAAGIWELKELYVDPFFQGTGCGRALMENFLASARNGGVDAAILWVLEKCARAPILCPLWLRARWQPQTAARYAGVPAALSLDFLRELST